MVKLFQLPKQNGKIYPTYNAICKEIFCSYGVAARDFEIIVPSVVKRVKTRKLFSVLINDRPFIPHWAIYMYGKETNSTFPIELEHDRRYVYIIKSHTTNEHYAIFKEEIVVEFFIDLDKKYHKKYKIERHFLTINELLKLGYINKELFKLYIIKNTSYEIPDIFITNTFFSMCYPVSEDEIIINVISNNNPSCIKSTVINNVKYKDFRKLVLNNHTNKKEILSLPINIS